MIRLSRKMMADESENRPSCTKIWALSSLGLVKSRGTQRATRIWAVAASVLNMPLPFSGTLSALWAILCTLPLCREPLWRDGDVKGSGGGDEDGEH